MDAFAEHRNALVTAGQRRGHTLSIGWPYWKDGGMAMPEASIAAMERAVGAHPLGTEAGLAALDAALAVARRDGLSHILVLDGDHERLRRLMGADCNDCCGRGICWRGATNGTCCARRRNGGRRVEAMIAETIAAELKVPRERLAVRETLDRYGLDSVSALQVIDRLEQRLGPLPKNAAVRISLRLEAGDRSARDAWRAVAGPAAEAMPLAAAGRRRPPQLPWSRVSRSGWRQVDGDCGHHRCRGPLPGCLDAGRALGGATRGTRPRHRGAAGSVGHRCDL